MPGSSHRGMVVVMDRVFACGRLPQLPGRTVTPIGAVFSSGVRWRARGDVISIRGLRMFYGDFEAVRGIDVDVHRGEIYAFVGREWRGQDDDGGDLSLEPPSNAPGSVRA